VQIAWQLHDAMGNCIEHQDYLIKPEGYNIPFDAEKIHGISTALADEQGITLTEMLEKFNAVLTKTSHVVGQNVGFDINIMGAEFFRLGMSNTLKELPVLDTCTETTAALCQIPGGRGGRFKLPTLTELHRYLFAVPFGEAHNATADVEATTRCFFELIRKRSYSLEQLNARPDYFERFDQNNSETIQLIGLQHINLKAASEKIRQRIASSETPKVSKQDLDQNLLDLANASFSHCIIILSFLYCNQQLARMT
jgi:DNA polymerase-3 subunit alpha